MLVGVCLYNIFDILEIFLKEHCGRPNLIESDALQGLLFFNVIVSVMVFWKALGVTYSDL